MEHVIHLTCVVCKRQHTPEVPYTCPACGRDGILDIQYDYEKARRTLTRENLSRRTLHMWRYQELLPIDPRIPYPPPQVGWTPLYEVPRLASQLGLFALFLKDDGRNHTGSFKDRASAVGVMKARELGFSSAACASTGNAASSLAGMAASAGLETFIFVPETAPDPKVAQLLIFGSHVMKVKGSYEDAYDLCMQACEQYGWYNRNCAINPYLVEGKKTAGLEIGEQMGEEIPEWVVVSVGDGCTVAGVWKGIREMHALGFIPRLPRILGVQAEGAAPVLKAFETGEDLKPLRVHSIADSIAVGEPRNWRKAVAAIKESGGTMVAVSDEEILTAMKETARLGGVFGEPAGVAGVAGVRKALEKGAIGEGESVLVVVTGNGLKDVKSAMQAVPSPLILSPDLDHLASALEKEGLTLKRRN